LAEREYRSGAVGGLLSAAGLLVLAGWLASAAAAVADEIPASGWPQWRGAGGLGVASERNLAVRWGERSPNIRWRTRLPGLGNSSPIVSNGRVILTTAYESRETHAWRRGVGIAGSALALVFTGGVVVVYSRVGGRGRWGRACLVDESAGRFSRLLKLVGCFCFISLAMLVTVGRSQSGWLFGKVGSLLARVGLGDMEHLVSMDAGVRAAVWLTSGGVALLGLAAGLGWLRRHSG